MYSFSFCGSNVLLYRLAIKTTDRRNIHLNHQIMEFHFQSISSHKRNCSKPRKKQDISVLDDGILLILASLISIKPFYCYTVNHHQMSKIIGSMLMPPISINGKYNVTLSASMGTLIHFAEDFQKKCT